MSGFDGALGVRRICERLEQNIETLGDEVVRQGVRGADRKVIAMFGEFANDAEKLLAGMAPGADRERVAEAARRDGDMLLREAVSTLEGAGERHATAQIASVRDGLVRRVAADPARLASARRTLEDLADAGELSDAIADAVKRQGVAALEAAASAAVSPGPESGPTSTVAGRQMPDAAPLPVVLAAVRDPESGRKINNAAPQREPDTVPADGRDAAVPAAEVERPEDLRAPADELAGGSQGDRPGRNELLEAEGFEFTDDPEGGFWTGPGGERASPAVLRDLVVDRLEERAEREGWSSARILTELHRAKQGLPQDDARNVETAFAFLPFLPILFGGSTAGAGAAIAGVAKAIVGGAGFAAILSLSGDTPLDDIEQVDEAASTARPETREGEDDDRELVRVYRVETSRGTNQRFVVHPDGVVTIRERDSKGRKRMLHVNFGQRARAIEFLEQKLAGKGKGKVVDPVIKSFLVPKQLLERIRAAAISQDFAEQKDPFRLSPREVDKTKAPDQFELPFNWILDLKENVIQPTGRIERPEDVLP